MVMQCVGGANHTHFNSGMTTASRHWVSPLDPLRNMSQRQLLVAPVGVANSGHTHSNVEKCHEL